MSTRSIIRRRWLWVAVPVILTVAAGWAVRSSAPSSDPAVWQVAPGEKLSAESTSFTAQVYRVGCNSGVDGDPDPPVVELRDNEIVITFEVQPHSSGGDCQGTMGVPYDVALGEPLGNRTLVDGECREGGNASSTSFCAKDGVRFRNGDSVPMP